MGHIFISYSHKDKQYVHRLQEALQKEGFEVWIDDRIDYGTRWPKVIQDQLDACSIFIVVASENSYESEWVQNEVARAKRKGKPFFPLLIGGEPWLSVETTQYVDLRDQSLPTRRFYDRLGSILPRKKNTKPVEKPYVAPRSNLSLLTSTPSQPTPKKEVGGEEVVIKAILIAKEKLVRKFQVYFNSRMVIVKFEYRYYTALSDTIFVSVDDQIVYQGQDAKINFAISVAGNAYPSYIEFDDDNKIIGLKLTRFILKINGNVIYAE